MSELPDYPYRVVIYGPNYEVLVDRLYNVETLAEARFAEEVIERASSPLRPPIPPEELAKAQW